MNRFFCQFLNFALGAMIGSASWSAFAVSSVGSSSARSFYTKDLSQIRSYLNLPIKDYPRRLVLPRKNMLKRLSKYKQDERVEPLSLVLRDDNKQIKEIADRVAKVGKESRLFEFLKKQWRNSSPISPGSDARMVVIDKNAFKLIEVDAFGELFMRYHHQLTLDASKMNSSLTEKLASSIRDFMGKPRMRQAIKRIQFGEDVAVRQVVPKFASRVAGKFVNYRGPNCFHAALAFHNPKLAKTKSLNVKREEGYHRVMVNYDELWRSLQLMFYEVDPSRQPLKYGDLIIFSDVPSNSKPSDPFHFRWIRHATTFLFNGYTFSKGSKSPNSPYVVQSLQDEWNSWQKISQNLVMKVFRRNHKEVKKTVPKDLLEWLY